MVVVSKKRRMVTNAIAIFDVVVMTMIMKVAIIISKTLMSTRL